MTDRDWTGNSRSVFATTGATSHSAAERQAHDLYCTPPDAVDRLLRLERFAPDVLEPCCGTGCVSRVLAAHGYRVQSQDLYDYGFGTPGVDFLKYDRPFDGDVVTNPPYSLATEFILHALDLIPPGNRVAMLLRLQFLESADRYRRLYERGCLERVYVAATRLSCAKNGDFAAPEGKAVCYAWFLFRRDWRGEPAIRWFNLPDGRGV